MKESSNMQVWKLVINVSAVAVTMVYLLIQIKSAAVLVVLVIVPKFVEVLGQLAYTKFLKKVYLGEK